MLSGVMLLWFLLTAISVIFVAWDIRSTPESPVLKAGFVLLTCYTGPVGAFLYVLGCREKRVVSGKSVLCMQMTGTVQGTSFMYYGYYYGGPEGTLQVICYTTQELFDQA